MLCGRIDAMRAYRCYAGGRKKPAVSGGRIRCKKPAVSGGLWVSRGFLGAVSAGLVWRFTDMRFKRTCFLIVIR